MVVDFPSFVPTGPINGSNTDTRTEGSPDTVERGHNGLDASRDGWWVARGMDIAEFFLARLVITLVNTINGQDLADLLIEVRPSRVNHAGNLFHEDMLPCLQPGTMISVHNRNSTQYYFWNIVRPKISQPFVLLTGFTDRDSPLFYHTEYYGDHLNDSLLLKFYGKP